MELIEVKTTLENKKDAERIAAEIIKKGLGACVQITKIKSVYRWEGKINKTEEWLISIKTKKSLYKKLERFILENHPYKIPEIIAIEITKKSKNYGEWIKDNVV
ncbi:MAG: divalent-cation tolerance protein CutA [Candidatus Bilamarchaeaceae archaeon]